MDLGEKMKTLRDQRGLTLQDVADVVGVGKSTVRKWENGDIKNMGRDKIALVAKALNVTPGYLMGWEEGNEEGGDNAPEPAHSSETWKLISAGCSNLSEEKLNRIYDVLKAVFPEDFKEGGKDK